jgi:hypothetical protein
MIGRPPVGEGAAGVGGRARAGWVTMRQPTWSACGSRPPQASTQAYRSSTRPARCGSASSGGGPPPPPDAESAAGEAGWASGPAGRGGGSELLQEGGPGGVW